MCSASYNVNIWLLWLTPPPPPPPHPPTHSLIVHLYTSTKRGICLGFPALVNFLFHQKHNYSTWICLSCLIIWCAWSQCFAHNSRFVPQLSTFLKQHHLEFLYGLYEVYQCNQCYWPINVKTILQMCTSCPQTVDTLYLEDHSLDGPQFLIWNNGDLDWWTNSQ